MTCYCGDGPALSVTGRLWPVQAGSCLKIQGQDGAVLDRMLL